MKFEVTPMKCIFNSENYQIYACNIDSYKYPHIKYNKYGNVTISGDCGDLSLGMLHDIDAEEKKGKYGYEYKIKYIKQKKPMSIQGLTAFLIGCGLSNSQTDEIVKSYPNIIDLVVENKLDQIDTTKLYNIGEYRLKVIIDKIQNNFMLADIVDKLGGYFPFNIIKNLFQHYASVDKIIESLTKNPYKCLCGINRVGFKTADKTLLALENKIATDKNANKKVAFEFAKDLKTSKDRCMSAIEWLLNENELNGNTILDINKLVKDLKTLVPECCKHFVDICKNRDDDDIKEYFYINLDKKIIANANTARKEFETGVMLANAVKNSFKWKIDTKPYKTIDDITLSDEQFNTLQMVCDNNISVLSGNAGSGKSQSTLALIKMLQDNDKRFLLLAPTGRASKVLSEYTKCYASTIHKLLFTLQNQEIENYKIQTDIIIIDEVSMCDLSLFYDLLKFVDFKQTKMLLIGDPAQLPSVGAGNILFDLINCEKIVVNNLTKIFRYGNNSILTVATDIRNSCNYLKKNLGDNKYVFIDTQQEEMLSKVKILYKKLLENGYKMEDILILSAYNKGDYGTNNINNLLQPIVNANINNPNKYIEIKTNFNNKTEITKFCINDIVIQTKNNYKAVLCNSDFSIKMKDFKEEQVFIPNGEIGTILKIEFNNIFIKFDNEIVAYTKDDMNNVKLAYSISIHKSQGGSAKVIILLTPKAHTFMLNSNLLYVGVTRAKEKVIHFGTAPTINLAIRKKADTTRHTYLQNYIKLAIKSLTNE